MMVKLLEELVKSIKGKTFSPRSPHHSEDYREKKRIEKGDYKVIDINCLGGPKSVGVWVVVQYICSKEYESVPLAKVVNDTSS